MRVDVVDHEVVEYDELVLLVVQLALLLKNLVEQVRLYEKLQSKVTRLLVYFGDFCLGLAALVRVRTGHTEADGSANVQLARRQVHLHRRIPYCLVNLNFLEDCVLYLLVKADLSLNVRKDLINVRLQSILVVRFLNESLGKQVIAILLVLFS